LRRERPTGGRSKAPRKSQSSQAAADLFKLQAGKAVESENNDKELLGKPSILQ
jgi:hypothetical protein